MLHGQTMLTTVQAGPLAHGGSVLAGPALAGAGLVAGATLAGAWLARRYPARRQIWFAAAAGALLIIAGVHLLPGAWASARSAHLWPPLVLGAAVVAFTAAGLAARSGCRCQEHKQRAAGAAVAVALTIHRFLEGAAIALAGSLAVAFALAAHAFGEGLATGALLGGQPRRQVAGWLTLMCVSPVIGAAATDAIPMPEAAGPILLAVAAGVLAQAAWVSLRTAFSGLRHTRLLLLRPAATTTVAAVVTVLAVRGAG